MRRALAWLIVLFAAALAAKLLWALLEAWEVG